MTADGTPEGGLPLPPPAAPAAPGSRRQVAAMQRLTDEPIMAAVPVRAAGTTFWSRPPVLAAALALPFQLSRGSELIFPIGFVCVVVWMIVMNRLLARRTRPVRLGWGGVLAVGPMSVLLATNHPLTGKADRIVASWPRSSTTVDVSARSRWTVRPVTVHPSDTGAGTLRLEAITAAATVRLGLDEIARTPYTPPLPSPSWYADPVGPGGLRYWDGSQWTERTTQLWPYPAE